MILDNIKSTLLSAYKVPNALYDGPRGTFKTLSTKPKWSPQILHQSLV